MKVASYDIVFQEVPNETTLALNISGCPNRCHGCHSPHLWTDTGEELTTELIDALITRYGAGITCVCFMGGDQDPIYVLNLAKHVQLQCKKTAWYSGQDFSPHADTAPSWWLKISNPPLNYLKTGPYIETCGGLKEPTTNQRFYQHTEDNTWIDKTHLFNGKK